MKSSTILPVAALATLGRATWPSPLTVLNLTTHGISSHPPLETISLPSVPSASSSSSSHQPVEVYTLSSLPTAHSLSTHPPGATISVSSLPTARSSSSHRRFIYHTLPSPPTTHDVSSHSSVTSHPHSRASPAHNSSSSPPATIIPPSQPFAANISVVDVSPSATPCVCHGDHHHDPPCCHEEIRWQTVTRLVLIAVPTTVVDYDGKTRTVTKDRLSTVTSIQPHVYTTTIVDYKTHYTYKKSTPTTWAPPRRPVRPYPSIGLDTGRKPGPTPWDPPRKPHGTVRPYPPDDKKKHYKPTYTITVSGPETTCPAGFTCQPDDKYIGEKLVLHKGKVPWPAPPGCANHCVGGRGCWTECDKPHPKNPSRICPEGYSCQRRKEPAPTPVPEPPKQRPAPTQQPAPPAAHPEPPRGPAPMPPSPPFIPPPVVQPPPVPPPPAVLPPHVSPPATRLPPAAPPVALPPSVLPPHVGQPPAASSNPAARPPAAPVKPSTHVDTTPEVPPTPSHHCPAGQHPCPPRHANETVGAPETVTKAGAGLSVPAAAMAMIFAGVFGFFMV